ncbi:MAG: hypothetical protein AOA65_1267 [Candidatus Bathyarchaeota archaeon BA1]|nr:MAG: hypothetical protein AOA65_1267 [Candidatus Bathyarchaeota archaeon BA1]
MSLDRMVEKARRLLESGRVERVDEEHYNVIGDHGTYTVGRTYEGKVTCNCPGFMSKGRCSHSAAIIILTQTSRPQRVKRKGRG